MRKLIKILAPLVLLLAMLLPAGVAIAAPADSTRTDTFEFRINNCNGDVILISGTVHQITKVDDNGVRFVHFTTHGQGTSLNSGNEYVLNHSIKVRFTTGDDYEDQRVMLVSKGSEPNRWIRVRFSPNGPSFVDIECRA